MQRATCPVREGCSSPIATTEFGSNLRDRRASGVRRRVLNGAAARLVEKGDKVIIMTFSEYDDPRSAHRPIAVFVDEENAPACECETSEDQELREAFEAVAAIGLGRISARAAPTPDVTTIASLPDSAHGSATAVREAAGPSAASTLCERRSSTSTIVCPSWRIARTEKTSHPAMS